MVDVGRDYLICTRWELAGWFVYTCLRANLVRNFSPYTTRIRPFAPSSAGISDPCLPLLMDPAKLAKLQAAAAANRLGERFSVSHARGVAIASSLCICPPNQRL